MPSRRSTDSHRWEFRSRFRRGAFGWKSQPAVQRVREAVAEIKRVARQSPMVAAEGAVLFLEKVSPALEQVDSSSGVLGTAVNNAVAELAPVIASSGADAQTHAEWLERLWNAYQDAMQAAQNSGRTEEITVRIRNLVAKEVSRDQFVTKLIGRQLALE